MVKIRQACAEGRVADAEKLYEDYDFSQFAIENNNIQWLALRTLGHVDEARDLLLPLDRPEFLGRLIQLLSYTHFDPAHYPNLTEHLEKLGVMRHEVGCPMRTVPDAFPARSCVYYRSAAGRTRLSKRRGHASF